MQQNAPLYFDDKVTRDRNERLQNKHHVVAMRKSPSDKAPRFNNFKLSKIEFHFNV